MSCFFFPFPSLLPSLCHCFYVPDHTQHERPRMINYQTRWRWSYISSHFTRGKKKSNKRDTQTSRESIIKSKSETSPSFLLRLGSRNFGSQGLIRVHTMEQGLGGDGGSVLVRSMWGVSGLRVILSKWVGINGSWGEGGWYEETD